MKILRLFGVLTLAAALLVGSVGSVFAQEEAEEGGLFGILAGINVDEAGVGYIYVGVNAEELVEVSTTAETECVMPGEGTVPLAYILENFAEALEAGELEVAVQIREKDGVAVVVKLLVEPLTPVNNHHSGVVTSIEDGIITIVDKEGNEVTFDIPEGVSGGEIGQFVSTIGRRQPGIKNPIALAHVGVDDISGRLNRHLEAAEAEGDEERIGELEALLEKNSTWHLEVLDRVLAKFLDRFGEDHPATLAIQHAREVSTRGYEQAFEARGHNFDSVRAEWEGKRGKPKEGGPPENEAEEEEIEEEEQAQGRGRGRSR